MAQFRGFIHDRLLSEVRGAHEVREYQRSMGWEPFLIDEAKLEELAEKALVGKRDEIHGEIVSVASMYGADEDDAYRLLMWELTGSKMENFELTEGKLGKKRSEVLADKLGDILSDGESNWIAELYLRSKIGKTGVTYSQKLVTPPNVCPVCGDSVAGGSDDYLEHIKTKHPE
ncbi:MAG: hypothetical protein HWN51_00255, partial [Desulfobacterales bacterium]|nr:hypothetical protein [Desulfobacterales bacterium]